MTNQHGQGDVTRSMPSAAMELKAFGCQRTTTFFFLWAMFVLFDLALLDNSAARALQLILSVVAFLAALWLAISPASVSRFAGLLVATVALEWVRMPNIPNHILLAFFIGVTALAALAPGLLKPDRGGAPKLSDRAMALIRCEVLIMYFFAVLHKLNYDYFNPEVSCAVSMFRETRLLNRLLSTSLEVPSIMGILIAEALIPILLIIPRTRVLGVGVGLLFHYFLSFHPNDQVFGYSAMIFALFALFIPDDFLADLRGLVKRLSAWRLAGLCLIGVVVATAARAFGRGVDRAIFERLAHDLIAFGPRRLWLVFGFMAIAIYALTLSRRLDAEWRRIAYGPESREPSYFRSAPSWLLIFPILLFFNGLCPYLGFKTETSFAMFSNLRTEAGRTNHLFMPIRFRLANYEDDVVEIVDSSAPALRAFRENGECATYFELRRMTASSSDPDFTVTYIRNGQRTTLSRRDNPTADEFQPNPWILDKLLMFCPIQIDSGPQKCRH